MLPMIPEFARNEGGKGKQGCGRDAAKRRLNTRKERYSGLKLTVLGGGLYCCHSICEAILEAGTGFLLARKPGSHPRIAGQVAYGEPETLEERQRNGRDRIIHRYRRVNGIENRAGGRRLPANYLRFGMYNGGKKEAAYHNSRLCSRRTGKGNARDMAGCGRARRKIGNGHNNVLKNRGYHLEHSFGHGKNHANEIFRLLNLPAFLYHGIQALPGDGCRNARASFGRKGDFFRALRYETCRYLHECRRGLSLPVSGPAPDG